VRRALIIAVSSLGIVATAAMVITMTMAVDAQPDRTAFIGEGERVRLVERDADIPVHPGPRDPRVPFRFIGGSSGVILSIDLTSGWLQVRSERTDGEIGVGWIIRRYIQDAPEDHGPSGPDVASAELAWCPAIGSPDPYADGTLRLATWNIANLHARDGEATFGPPRPSVERQASDYQRIRCYIRLVDPDVLAVQEIDGADALQRVVDTSVYDVHVSGRGRVGDMNGQQNTGFAYKKGLDVTRLPDFDALSVNNRGLRRGARISVAYGDARLQLMSVHLKSGCFSNADSGSDCVSLRRQVPVLEDWINEQTRGPDPMILLGDFNRRMNDSGDAVWAELDDGQPANVDLTAVTAGMSSNCRDNRFPDFIDHIVFGLRSTRFVDRSSFRHVNLRRADRPYWNSISDHCPLVIDLFAP
jgi:endonuclease/exonuclease/phosphatase family metal-dependent hydrolase